MSITRIEGAREIEHFYRTYLAPLDRYSDLEYLRGSIELDIHLYHDYMDIYGLTARTALDWILEVNVDSLAVDTGFWAFDGIRFGNVLLRKETVTDKLPPDTLVNLLYPDASATDRAAMIQAMHSGQISHQDFVVGVVQAGQGGVTPSANAVLETIYDQGKGNLPDAGLSFPGISEAQLDFLLAMYIGAFSRAPEFAGLHYWAGDLAETMSGGDITEADALRGIAKAMYHSGGVTGEAGTGTGDGAFLDLAYASVLGRPPDAGGRTYWLEKLETGTETRDTFLFTFLTAALGADGDREYLLARIAVAGHAAQEHVSGPGVAGWPDLAGVLDGVTDPVSAYRAIQSIASAWGAADAPVAMASLLAAGTAASEDDALFLSMEMAGVEPAVYEGGNDAVCADPIAGMVVGTHADTAWLDVG